jgi:hypothetical protein
MKLKLDASGNAVLLDGKPVYVKDDGKEITFDATEAFAKIASLNADEAGFRRRLTEAEAKLLTYDGLDIVAAKKALEVVKTVDLNKLVDKGEVEKVRAEVSKVFETQIAGLNGELKTAKDTIRSAKIGAVFSNSKFITDKCAVPSDIIQARFGSHFSVDDAGNVIVKDIAGNQIFSRRPESAGSAAAPDEALEVLIEAYPYKNHILKGSGASGGGSGDSGGGGGGGGVVKMTQSQFFALPPAKQAELSRKGVVDIVKDAA